LDLGGGGVKQEAENTAVWGTLLFRLITYYCLDDYINDDEMNRAEIKCLRVFGFTT
jgi:hypothetical protein